MQGPGHIEVDFKENLDGNFKRLVYAVWLRNKFLFITGTIHVQYKPSDSGVYKLNIKFGDIPVQGSPFIINVS